jgi:hypothetical protein
MLVSSSCGIAIVGGGLAGLAGPGDSPSLEVDDDAQSKRRMRRALERFAALTPTVTRIIFKARSGTGDVLPCT